MPFNHRPLIFRALVVLREAAKACHDHPMEPSPGVRLALAYLCAIGGDRANLGGFVESIGDPGLPDAAAWQPRYIRQRDATSAISGIVRSLGFNPTVAVLRELDEALKLDWRAAAKRFWANVDQQVELGMCRGLRPYEWTRPRAKAATSASDRPASASETRDRAPS